MGFSLPVLLGGIVLVLFALLSLKASEGAMGRKRSGNTILGMLTVAAVLLVSARAGAPWLGLGLALLWGAAKRFGGGDRGDASAAARSSSAPSGRGTEPMTRAEAYDVLGLAPGAPAEQILAQYRRLMKKVHPDQGGTTYLATRLNQAKDVLLDG
jgi:DnaJ family protein C protein 19